MFEQFKRSIQPLINVYHHLRALLAAVYYGFPARRIAVIGVTGTDGKTTTAHLIYHILKKQGKRVSIASSIFARSGSEVFNKGLHTTTPDAFLVQKLLKAAVDAGHEYFVLETTSHALDQGRVFGIPFEAGVITNITSDHLDYHKTYEKYLEAKTKLLLRSKTALVNRDDPSYEKIVRLLKKNKKQFLTYGLKNSSDYSFDFKELINPKITDYNNYNYLAAASVALSFGFQKEVIIRALKDFTLPQGRLETVYDRNFTVIIDFAHTPNSILEVLKNLRARTKRGRIIHVFGSAGLRDYQKRPYMGEASASYSDVIILTEEDYRTEDPQKIAEEIAQGVRRKGFRYVSTSDLTLDSKKCYTTILERDKAIEKAISIAKKDDILITTGKSHEQSLCRGKHEYPWSEHEAVQKALKKL